MKYRNKKTGEIIEVPDEPVRRMRNKRTGEVVELVDGEWGPAVTGTPAAETGPFSAALIGAGRAFTELGRGVKQLFGGQVERDPAEERAYAALQQQHRTATALGESAPFVAGGLLAGLPLRGAGLLANLAGQARTGAALGLAMPGTTEERVARGAIEGALSGVGELGGRALAALPGIGGLGLQRRAVRVPAGLEALPSTGIDSRALRQTVEGGLEATPGGAMVLSEVHKKNQGLLDRLAANSIGEAADAPTDEVLAAARERIGNEFDRLMPDTRTISAGLQGPWARLNQIADESIMPFVGPGDPVAVSVSRAKALLERPEANAAELMAVQSRLGKQARAALRGENSNPELGHALYDIQRVLLDVAEGGLQGADKQAFAEARRQYRNLATLESGRNVDPVTGHTSASALASYLQRRDRPGFMEGGNRSPLYEAVRFLGREQQPLPTSGTAERSYVGRTAAGLAGIGGGAAVGGSQTGSIEDAAVGAGVGGAAAIGLPYLAARTYVAPAVRDWMITVASPAMQQYMRGIGLAAPRATIDYR